MIAIVLALPDIESQFGRFQKPEKKATLAPSSSLQMRSTSSQNRSRIVSGWRHNEGIVTTTYPAPCTPN